MPASAAHEAVLRVHLLQQMRHKQREIAVQTEFVLFQVLSEVAPLDDLLAVFVKFAPDAGCCRVSRPSHFLTHPQSPLATLSALHRIVTAGFNPVTAADAFLPACCAIPPHKKNPGRTTPTIRLRSSAFRRGPARQLAGRPDLPVARFASVIGHHVRT